MTSSKFKYDKKESTLNFLKVGKDSSLQVLQTNKEGIIWCDNCYTDNVPIMEASFNKRAVFTLCESCIRLIFQIFKEGA